MNRRGFISIAAVPLIGGGLSPALERRGKSFRQFTGEMEEELVPEFSFSSSGSLSRASNSDLADVNFDTSDIDQAFVGTLKHVNGIEPIRILLIESKGGKAYLFSDVKREGQFTSSQITRFMPVPQRPKAIGDAVVRVPLASGPFRTFPIRVRLFPSGQQPGGADAVGQRTVFYSFVAYATAVVNIGDRDLRVWCEYDVEKAHLDPRNGAIGMDLDGDGILSWTPSPEYAVAKGEDVVFQVGAQFLSIHLIDAASRTLILRSHSASDYLRIQLKTGLILPDFEFIDFSGHRQVLSGITANCRYVLLDFWGSWCGPCVGEIPFLKRAHEEFKERGFEILGIDCDEPSAKASACIGKNQLSWVQATSDSTDELTHKRLQISSYPTQILLDNERRIVSLGNAPLRLRGEDLLMTLNKLLPNSSGQ